MAKQKKTSTDDMAAEAGASVSLETLEGTPPRVLQFLRAVGTTGGIRAALRGRGYGAKDHREGWDLLHTASGFVADDEGEGTPADDPRVRDAIVELDGTDEKMVRIVSATFRRRFPALATAMLAGLRATSGVGAVLVIATLLDRIDALEKKGGKDAKAAVALLAKRGYDEAERKRLRGLVHLAQSMPDAVPIDAETAEAARRRHVDALVELRKWYEEWSEIARAAVSRRDHLINLGLASRRSSAPSAASDESADDGAEEDTSSTES